MGTQPTQGLAENTYPLIPEHCPGITSSKQLYWLQQVQKGRRLEGGKPCQPRGQGKREYIENKILIKLSEIFDVREELGVLQPTHQFVPVLHMGDVVLDSAVEDVFQRMFPHELEAQDSDCLAELLISPEVPDLFDCVYMTSTIVYEIVEFGLVEPQAGQELAYSCFVASDVENGCLPVIFGDVFGFVFVGPLAGLDFVNRIPRGRGLQEQRILPAIFYLQPC